MINPSTPYRHHEIEIPKIAPFDTAGNLIWPTIVGSLLRKVIEHADSFGMVYWFCNHYPVNFQFCFASENYHKIEEKLQEQKDKYNIKRTNETGFNEHETVGTALEARRFMENFKCNDMGLRFKRVKLLLEYLHATSALYISITIEPFIDNADRQRYNETKMLPVFCRKWNITVKNLGKTPATRLMVETGCETFKGSIKNFSDLKKWDDHIKSAADVGPGEQVLSLAGDREWTGEEIADEFNHPEGTKLYVFGRVNFVDIFGVEVTTYFCRFLVDAYGRFCYENDCNNTVYGNPKPI